jgi:CheY-like chemotaxis protein
VETAVSLLVVEDEPLILVAAQDALEAGGFQVVAAGDGAEGLRLLGERIGDIAGLITDIRLGGGHSGWDLARHARSLRPELPIVYTTGDSAHEWPVKGVPKSILIQKPYADAQLLTAISGLLNESGSAILS